MSPTRLPPAASWASARACSIPSVTNVKGGPELAGGLWVTTKHGTSFSGPLPPQRLDRVVVGPAAHDHGTRSAEQVAEHLLEHGRIVERPVMEPHPVLAEPLLRIVIGSRDVAVQ